jgi:multicomponent Na+:H+ antiporter subunit D
MGAYLPLFVALPLLAGFACLLLKSATPRATPWLSVASMSALLALSILAVARGGAEITFAGGWDLRPFGDANFVAGIALVLDGLSRLFLLLVAVVGTAAAVYALRYLGEEPGRPLFHVLFNLLVAGMNGALLAGDLFNLYVFVEVASIASYGLVAYRPGGTEVEAAFKYLVLGTVASTAILLGVTVLYAATGFLNMADLAAAIAAGAVPGVALLFASALFVLGFATKTAAMPFHAWLPDAHPSAPAPISAMLSGLLIKTLGIYALVRVFYVVVGIDEHVRLVLTVLGCLSMWGGVLLAQAQDDLKRLLAYSSVSQMGYVLVALALGTWLGVAAALFHAVNHALFKSALFLSSGSLERVTGTRRLSEMGGVFRRAPATSAGLVGASLSIAGIPPFNGFWSKLLILIALVSAGEYLVAGLAAGAALMTLVTFVKAQREAVFGALPARLAGAREVPATMYLPVLALVTLCLLSGLLWPVGVDGVVGAAASAVRAPADQPPAATHYVEAIHGSPAP